MRSTGCQVADMCRATDLHKDLVIAAVDAGCTTVAQVKKFAEKFEVGHDGPRVNCNCDARRGYHTCLE